MEVNEKVRRSFKWTFATEFLSKLIVPVTGMVLARILSPSAFGVVASILVATSFAEIFADAGFQKYFVQHDFQSEESKKRCFITALITCCTVALFCWLLICFLAKPIAALLGVPDIYRGLQVASLGILLNSFNGMQGAIFRREFQFQLLFKVRVIALLTPIFVSIPLALLGFDYWALIIGTLVQQLATCIFQVRYVSIPVSFRFDFASLKEMLSFSLWTLFESITIWLSTWGDLFIVGTLLSSYYLGLFRGSSTLTNAAFSLITGAIIPVLFSGLSRVQSDMYAFDSMYYDIEKKSILFVAPIGVGIFVFRDIAVSILLGAQWHEADFLVGLRGLVGCFSVVINSMGSEALRAKGMPRLSALSQIFYFPVMFAVLYVTAPLGFDILAIGTCLCSLELDCVKLVILNKCLGFSLRKLIGSICPAMGSAVLAGGMVHLFRSFLGTDSIMVSIISMLLFGVLYLGIVCLSRENRDFLLAIFKKVEARVG